MAIETVTPVQQVQPQANTDEARRARLRRMTRLATGLLLVSGVVLVIAHLLQPRYPWLAYVVATAEAAMVGGLADWFAVTALFRHPLGIPVPHTAIIPARKNQVGRSLGGFVQRHFLAPEVVSAKLQNAGVADHLIDWVRDPANAHMIAHKAATGLATGIRANEQSDIQQAIADSIARKVDRTPVAPLLAGMLTLVTTDNRHQELFEPAVEMSLRGKSAAVEVWRVRPDR